MVSRVWMGCCDLLWLMGCWQLWGKRMPKKCLLGFGFALALPWLWGGYAPARMLKDETHGTESRCPSVPAKVNLDNHQPARFQTCEWAKPTRVQGKSLTRLRSKTNVYYFKPLSFKMNCYTAFLLYSILVATDRVQSATLPPSLCTSATLDISV